MKDMLDRLSQADPNAFATYAKLMRDCNMFIDARISPAILQAVLQEAIQAHRSADFLNDWFWKIEYLDCDIYEATVYRRTGYISKERHDSPVAALLAAYLSAIEVQA